MTPDFLDRLAKFREDLIALAIKIEKLNAGTPRIPTRSVIKQTPLEALIGRAAFNSSVSLKILISKERYSEVSEVRQAIMAEAADAGYTEAAIGRALGNRDPSTIHEGIAAHRLRVATRKAAGQRTAQHNGGTT